MLLSQVSNKKQNEELQKASIEKNEHILWQCMLYEAVGEVVRSKRCSWLGVLYLYFQNSVNSHS